jgi:hypothetical protein
VDTGLRKTTFSGGALFRTKLGAFKNKTKTKTKKNKRAKILRTILRIILFTTSPAKSKFFRERENE